MTLLVLKSESDVYTQKIEIELIATNLKDIVAECLDGYSGSGKVRRS